MAGLLALAGTACGTGTGKQGGWLVSVRWHYRDDKGGSDWAIMSYFENLKTSVITS
jgi:hypothetical protein